jgi:GTP cyclohydrolase I
MFSMMRGVKKVNVSMKTSKMLGLFKDEDNPRRKFLSQINSSR